MRIRTSELHLGGHGYNLAEEQRRAGFMTNDSLGAETGKDRVSISFAGRSLSSSRKLSGLLTHSLVKDKGGRESRFSQGTFEAAKVDSGVKNRWQLGISNIRNTGRPSYVAASRTSYEKERMAFSGSGNITMEDGRQVEFSLEMLMQREFEMQENDALGTSTVKLMDPLVINFAGNTPKLTDAKFHFDLDADGFYENISFVGQGSGFLTLDVNNDGVVNDGRELFGPNTGNGFGELSAYDKDGNQWIDENDPIYKELRIWSKDGEGKDKLQSLKELGVGAISLKNAATPFSITNHSNELQGKVSQSSIMMEESGAAHTVQQIDLMATKTGVAVSAPEPIATPGFDVAMQGFMETRTNRRLENELEVYQQQESQQDEQNGDDARFLSDEFIAGHIIV